MRRTVVAHLLRVEGRVGPCLTEDLSGGEVPVRGPAIALDIRDYRLRSAREFHAQQLPFIVVKSLSFSRSAGVARARRVHYRGMRRMRPDRPFPTTVTAPGPINRADGPDELTEEAYHQSTHN
jgi:hypothetical protein